MNNMDTCSGCAGSGTTAMAAIALILVIIFIIVFLILYFYPSKTSLLDINGINWSIVNSSASGGPDNLITGQNSLYMSQTLTSDLTLSVLSNSNNFSGTTIGIKNNSPIGNTYKITVTGTGSGGYVSISPSVEIPAQGFAWFVYTSGNIFVNLLNV